MAASLESLEIRGYDDQPVPNALFESGGEPRRVGMIFPGAGYTAQMPLLWYARCVLQEAGADVLTVDYDYSGLPGGTDTEERLQVDVAAAVRAVRERWPDREIVAVG